MALLTDVFKKISKYDIDFKGEQTNKYTSPKINPFSTSCSYHKYHKKEIPQHMTQCFDCYSTGGHFICNHCAKTCHKGHRLGVSYQIIGKCICGKNGCNSKIKKRRNSGDRILEERNFEVLFKQKNPFKSIRDFDNVYGEQTRDITDLEDIQKNNDSIYTRMLETHEIDNVVVDDLSRLTRDKNKEQKVKDVDQDIMTDILDFKQTKQTKTVNIPLINNYFGSGLLKFINKKSLIISPYSIITTIIPLYMGSSGNTKKELKKALILGNRTNTFKELSTVFSFLNQLIKIYNCFIYKKYISVNTEYYNYVKHMVQFIPLDESNPIKTISIVNNSISKITNNNINNVIPLNMDIKTTQIIMVSIIYFRCYWKTKFRKKINKRNYFYSSDQKTKSVMEFMTINESKHMYTENKYFKLLELKCADPRLTFGIFLPKKKMSKNMLSNIPLNDLVVSIENLTLTEISRLELPKFKQRTKISLIPILYGMKCSTIYKSVSIDNLINNKTDVKIEILHSAFIDINEHGAELDVSLPNKYSNNDTQFVANHTFLYYVRFIPTNMLIFMGIL